MSTVELRHFHSPGNLNNTFGCFKYNLKRSLLYYCILLLLYYYIIVFERVCKWLGIYSKALHSKKGYRIMDFGPSIAVRFSQYRTHILKHYPLIR